jgi:type IV pilus assembly protein PilZ
MEYDAQLTKQVSVQTVEELHSLAMGFIKGGAIFIPCQTEHQLGQHLSVCLSLLDDAPIEYVAEVIWITPAGAQRGLTAGIGVQAVEPTQRESLRQSINTHLADMLESAEPTETM